MMKIALMFCLALGCVFSAFGADDKKTGKAAEPENVIKLPEPEKKGGMPLMEALTARKTTRDFSPEKLSLQEISNILYAACGVNRPSSGKRTIGFAMERRDLIIYVVLEEGVYIYKPDTLELELKLKKDLRPFIASHMDMSEVAAMSLIYVSDTTLWPDPKDNYTAIHVGEAVQGVYLYCASAKLGAVASASFYAHRISESLKLPEGHKIQLAQVIGKPAKVQKETGYR